VRRPVLSVAEGLAAVRPSLDGQAPALHNHRPPAHPSLRGVCPGLGGRRGNLASTEPAEVRRGVAEPFPQAPTLAPSCAICRLSSSRASSMYATDPSEIGLYILTGRP